MKRLFAFIFIAFLLSHPGFAQTLQQSSASSFPPEITFGLRGGLNLSSVSAFSNYLGFHGAITGDFQTSDRFGYSSEIGFSKQGGYTGGTTLTTNYISVPLLLNIYTGRFTWQAGGYSALLLQANVKTGYGFNDVTGALTGSDFGLVAGFKLRVLEKAGVGLRYYLGLKEISGGNYFPFNSQLYNSTLQFSLNYHF
ncbi:MAG TPA: outer membrane beta-barrel protein [Adhaeribacter sp.]|nr:outer membrane beta-barrel protein [Adhaeribacter sp.]